MEDHEETRRLSDRATMPKLTDSLGRDIKRFGRASHLLGGERNVSVIEREETSGNRGKGWEAGLTCYKSSKQVGVRIAAVRRRSL